MSFVRTNAVALLLIVVVLAVTALNTVTTATLCNRLENGETIILNEMYRNKMVHDLQITQSFKEEQLARVTSVAESEALRAERAEALFNDLATRYVELRQLFNQVGIECYGLQEALREAIEHINKCHALLKEEGIEPPAYTPPVFEIEPQHGGDKSA